MVFASEHARVSSSVPGEREIRLTVPMPVKNQQSITHEWDQAAVCCRFAADPLITKLLGDFAHQVLQAFFIGQSDFRCIRVWAGRVATTQPPGEYQGCYGLVEWSPAVAIRDRCDVTSFIPGNQRVSTIL